MSTDRGRPAFERNGRGLIWTSDIAEGFFDHWILDEDTNVLFTELPGRPYEIGLDGIFTGLDAIRWIEMVASKEWATTECLAELAYRLRVFLLEMGHK